VGPVDIVEREAGGDAGGEADALPAQQDKGAEQEVEQTDSKEEPQVSAWGTRALMARPAAKCPAYIARV
jgi:hypothetical protein